METIAGTYVFKLCTFLSRIHLFIHFLARQQREITKICVFCERKPRRNYLNCYSELNAAYILYAEVEVWRCKRRYKVDLFILVIISTEIQLFSYIQHTANDFFIFVEEPLNIKVGDVSTVLNI